MIVTLDHKRRLTVPVELVPAKPGDRFGGTFDADEDTLSFRRLPGKEDWVEVLKQCPLSANGIPLRRRESAKRKKL